MGKRGGKVSLFSYLDYRRFLKDWYEQERAASSLSLRIFSKKAGFTSPNYLKMVMDGDRNLSDDSIEKFVVALGLNKQEEEFFRNLVHFNQTKRHQEKDKYYQRLLQSRKFIELKPIEKEQYEFYSTWYHSVIRELLSEHPVDSSPEEIAKKIYPEVTPQQVRKSIELLEKMEFISKGTDGLWKQTTPVVTTGSESGELTLLNYHQGVFDVAKKILDEIPQNERDVSALTLGISADKLGEIKKKIQAFRREILDMVSNESHPSQVVLLTMQLMPVTRKEDIAA